MTNSTIPKIEIPELINALEASELSKRLGIGSSAISNVKQSAAESGTLIPSGWYDIVEQMAVEKGVDCPRNLFNWKVAGAQANSPAGEVA